MKFFCYERDFAGHWCPVFYAIKPEPPPKERASDRSTVWPVDDAISLEEAAARLPAPVEKEKV